MEDLVEWSRYVGGMDGQEEAGAEKWTDGEEIVEAVDFGDVARGEAAGEC